MSKTVESEEKQAAPAVVKACIIEDRREIREGLALLVDATEGFRCTGSFRSMEEALALIGRDLPDVALVDIGLPGMSGIDGIRILAERYPSLQMLMLTVYDDDDRIFGALCAGATGYLLKKTPPDRILESLREAAKGGSPMSPEVARRVVTVFRKARPAAGSASELTPHENRVLRLLVVGHNYKTAAAELGVSYNTVAFHVKHIYQKLQVHSKSEAVARALRNGLVD